MPVVCKAAVGDRQVRMPVTCSQVEGRAADGGCTGVACAGAVIVCVEGDKTCVAGAFFGGVLGCSFGDLANPKRRRCGVDA